MVIERMNNVVQKNCNMLTDKIRQYGEAYDVSYYYLAF
jgi:hypothetical protein